VPEAKISPQGSGIKKMKTQIEKSENLPLKDFLKQDHVIKEFAKLVQDPTNFIMSAITTIQQNNFPADIDRNSVLFGLMNAAILKLPINQNFGLAYLIPYRDNKKGKTYAQFQIGAKGFIALAIRSGLVINFSTTEVYDGQLLEFNPLTGSKFDFSKKQSNKIIGFACYLELKNGFKRTEFMTYEQMMAHAKRYSESFKHNQGAWVTNFIEMGCKTIGKLTLKKYMPFLTDEIGRALQTDQAVIVGENEFVYIDNENDDDVVNEVITKENKETKKTTKKTTTKQDEDQNTDNEVVTEQSNVTTDVDNEIDDTEIPF
jgi:recombination protein RecT